VLAAFFVGGVGTLGAMAGLLSVIGIAARSNILLIRSYRGDDDESGVLGADLVMRTTRDRLAPIVLSALATAFAFLPVLFLGDTAGTEIIQPMAVVVIGGLVTSTVLTLFVLPGLYLFLTGGSAGTDPVPVHLEPEPTTAPELVPS
jgi:multidrug efflux pump subunit AcrB